MNARRQRSQIAADLRDWVDSRKVYVDTLLYEALLELLEPAPQERTLLAKTLRQWEELPLTEDELDRVRAAFKAGYSVAEDELSYLVELRYRSLA